MIIDSLLNASKYFSLHRGFKPAFEYLCKTDLTALTPGKYEIDGHKLFLLAASNIGKGRQGVKLEAHRKYIDIQISVKGIDDLGWRALNQCSMINKPYDEQADVIFYDDSPRSWFDLQQGDFVIFFPQDAHAPFAVNGRLVKIVIKVAVEY